MARDTSPVCKQCRREREKLFLKGDRCLSDKCAVEKKPYPPGESGRRRPQETEYWIQLRQKQKAKRIYGLLEKQFRNTYDSAQKQKGVTGENLLKLLESRLDNVIYRAGFASSRREARQLVNHGHFQVNNRRVDISSFRCKKGDQITLSEKGKKVNRIKECVESPVLESPNWLNIDQESLTIVISDIPERDQIETTIKEQIIVELYSK